MRTRTAVLSLLLLSIAPIAIGPPGAIAMPASQAPESDTVDSIRPGAPGTVDLKVHPVFLLRTARPTLIRLTRFDSAGHELMRIEIRSLPNPARPPRPAGAHYQRAFFHPNPVCDIPELNRQANVLGRLYFEHCETWDPVPATLLHVAPVGVDPRNYTERPAYKPLSFLRLPASHRKHHERLSSALRVSVAVGTLHSTGRFKRS